jgi:predicted RNA-binding protein with PUA-like domain
VPATRNHWLVKSEPETFSWDDLWAAPRRTTCWDGVRNYQARNFMRDGMRVGDPVLFYHSNAEPPAVVGVAEVVREAYPDHTALDPDDPHYDPRSDPANPAWLMVDIRAVRQLARPLALTELRQTPGLEGMELLRKGSRLSVQPVTPGEFDIITRLGAR